MLKLYVVVLITLATAQAQTGRQHFHLVPVDEAQRQQQQPRPQPQQVSGPRPNYEDLSPKPYSFNYDAVGEDGGATAREEVADGSGRVTGSYRLQDPDGRSRLVQYIADANGFRAQVETNEEGTESQNPADVNFQSSAPTAYELVQRYAAAYGQRPVVQRPAVAIHQPEVRPVAPPPAPPTAHPPAAHHGHRPGPDSQQPVTTVINGRRYILVPVYE